MEVTLRKASKIANKADRILTELRGLLSAASRLRLDIYEPVDQSVKKIEDAATPASELLVDIERLMTVRSSIRQQIGVANGKSHTEEGVTINSLIATLAELQQKVGFFSGFAANAVAKVPVEVLQTRIKTLASAEHTYTRTVEAGALEQQTLDDVREQTENWQHRIEHIHDQLEYLNTNVTISLDTVDEMILRRLKVIL